MRYSEILNEKFVTTLTPDYGKRTPFDVFKNSSSKEWREIAPDGHARAFIVGDDVYSWSTYGDLHVNVRAALQLANPIPVVIYGEPNRRGASVEVTDMSKHTSWYHNPETAEAIHSCGFLRKFGEIEISYFDEAIVGDWEVYEDEDAEDDN